MKFSTFALFNTLLICCVLLFGIRNNKERYLVCANTDVKRASLLDGRLVYSDAQRETFATSFKLIGDKILISMLHKVYSCRLVLGVILLRFIRLQVLCLTFAQATYAQTNLELLDDLLDDVDMEPVYVCWDIGSRGIGTISEDICRERLGNECSGLSAHDKRKCVKSFAEKIDREIKLEFLALKSSRKNVTISKSRLPRISDSLREAENKISDMCLMKSPLYSWSRGYVHCGYFHGMYIHEIHVNAVRRWFRNQFSGYSLNTNVNENSISFIRTFIDDNFEQTSCFEQIVASYQRAERSIAKSCYSDGFIDDYGFNFKFSYWAPNNTLTLFFSKKP